jgi:hypothetical protein
MPRNSDSTPPESLLTAQRRFADHLRNPEEHEAPAGIEDRRLAIYRRLFFGNLNNLFSKNFPVLRRIIDDERWTALIREYMTHHRAHTPMFTEIGGEFVRFLEQHQPEGLPPFSLELAHWEYLETRVRLAEDDPNAVDADEAGALLESAPVLNPTLRLAQYHWPVHEIRSDFQPEEPLAEPIILAAWRHRDDRTGFIRLNAVTARLIALIEEQPGSRGRELLERIATEMSAPDPEAIVRSGAGMLERLREREIVLGARALQ